jgi:hypothetical protein
MVGCTPPGGAPSPRQPPRGTWSARRGCGDQPASCANLRGWAAA